jgi:hypothetical protein
MWQTALETTHLKKWLLCTSHSYLAEHRGWSCGISFSRKQQTVAESQTQKHPLALSSVLGKKGHLCWKQHNNEGKDRTDTVLGIKNFGRHYWYVPSGRETQQQNMLLVLLFEGGGGCYLSNSCVLTIWGQCEAYPLKKILERSRFVSRISQNGKNSQPERSPELEHQDFISKS